jgi:outer membrane protein TolC
MNRALRDGREKKGIQAFWLSGVLCVLGVLFLSAEKGSALTLGQAIDLALGNNPSQKSANLEEKLAHSQKIAAWGSYLPSLAVSETYINTNNPLTAFGILLNEGIVSQSTLSNINNLDNPSYTQTFGFAATVSETVYDGGNRYYGARAAAGEESRSRDLSRWKKETLIYDVTRAYLGILLADRRVAVVSEELAASNADETTAREQWVRGKLLRSDYLRAKVRATRLAVELLKSRRDARLARLELSRLLGRKILPGESLEQPVRLFDASVVLLGELSRKGEPALVDQALRQRPDYQAVRQEVRVRDRQVHQALSGFLPQVTAQGIYNEYNEGLSAWGKQSYTALGQVSWNLLNGLGNMEGRQQAKLRLRMALYRKEDLTRQLRYEVSRSLTTALVAREALKADRQAVLQAREALHIVRARYKVGLTDVVQVLHSEARYHDVRLQELADRYRLEESLSNLLWVTGGLLRNLPIFD